MINRGRLGRFAWMATATFVVGATGCSNSQQSAKSSPFVGQWGDRLSKLGLVAVIPPSEDIRVGDIYVFDMDTTPGVAVPQQQIASRRMAPTGRWGALPVLDKLEAEYSQRRAWPITPHAFAQLKQDPGAELVWQEPLASEGSSLFAPDDAPARLRAVGLDGFSAVSFSTAEMSLVLPTELASVVSGQLQSEKVSVTMRVGAAEGYSLSKSEAIALLAEEVAADDGGRQYRVRAPYRDNLEFMANALTGRVWLHLITEVVYIRSADIAVRSTEAPTTDDDGVTTEELLIAAQAAAAATPSQTPGETPGETSGTAPAVPQAVAVSKLDPAFGAFLRAQAINEVLVASNTADSTGSVLRFLSVTDHSASVRRIWPRGLAIGVRGLSMEVDAASGNILRSGPLGMASDLRHQSPK